MTPLPFTVVPFDAKVDPDTFDDTELLDIVTAVVEPLPIEDVPFPADVV